MEPYAAILLAGGQSLRMGETKSEMKIGRHTLLERTIRVLAPVVNQIVIMLNPSQAVPKITGLLSDKISFGRDSVQKRGPLQGIADALPLLPDDVDRIYVVTCDLPYLTEDWLKSMKDAFKEGVDVVHAVDDNITNPLLALYRREVLMKAKKLLDSNQRRPIRLWDGFQLVGLSAQPDNPMVCKDINTPGEFELAKQALSIPNY